MHIPIKRITNTHLPRIQSVKNTPKCQIESHPNSGVTQDLLKHQGGFQLRPAFCQLGFSLYKNPELISQLNTWGEMLRGFFRATELKVGIK